MKPKRIWLTAAAFLLLIWSGVAVVLHLTEDYVSSPEEVIELMTGAPWLNGRTEGSRSSYIGTVIGNVNRLDFHQTARLREEAQDIVDRFFDSLTPEEQKNYVDLTLERHFEAVSRGLKLLPAEDRKRLMTRLLADTRTLVPKEDQELVEMLLEEDPAFVLRGLPTKVKMKMAPAIETAVSRLNGRR